jgi:hypothetical protein
MHIKASVLGEFKKSGNLAEFENLMAPFLTIGRYGWWGLQSSVCFIVLCCDDSAVE